MAKLKGFEGLTPGMPLSAAATVIVTARIDAVRGYLPLAATRQEEEPEYVHQLRVATRRLSAALAALAPALDDEPRGRLDHAARRVRRIAGALRDADVLLAAIRQRLTKLGPHAARGAEALIAAVQERRERAVRALERGLGRRAEQFDRAAHQVLTVLQTPNRPADQPASFGTLAVGSLGERFTAFLEAGQADLTDLDALHQLRIVGKRLRYAMEVFGGCFRRELYVGVYKRVEALQTKLGELNDLRVLYLALVDLRSVPRRGRRKLAATAVLVERLAIEVAHELVERQRQFLARWPAKLHGDLAQRFRRMLADGEGKQRAARLPVSTAASSNGDATVLPAFDDRPVTAKSRPRGSHRSTE